MQRRSIPNHFRSLRTPSPSNRNAVDRVPQQVSKALGAIPDFRALGSSGTMDVPGTSDSPKSRNCSASPSSVMAINSDCIAAAEARVAKHKKLLAEKREAGSSMVSQDSKLQNGISKLRKPKLWIDTSINPAKQSSWESASRSQSPESGRGTPSSKCFNDGSKRFRHPEKDEYKAVLAEEHTELYTWLLNRQQNFWASRGL